MKLSMLKYLTGLEILLACSEPDLDAPPSDSQIFGCPFV